VLRNLVCPNVGDVINLQGVMEDWRDRCVHSARRLSLQDCINKGKGKGHPVTGQERPEGKWMHRSTLSLTSTQMGWVVNATTRPLYPPGKIPGTHCIGGWVGPRAGLDSYG